MGGIEADIEVFSIIVCKNLRIPMSKLYNYDKKK